MRRILALVAVVLVAASCSNINADPVTKNPKYLDCLNGYYYARDHSLTNRTEHDYLHSCVYGE